MASSRRNPLPDQLSVVSACLLLQPHSPRLSGIVRIVLTGSESVGKTTLATELAEAHGVFFVPEFIRTFTEERGAPPLEHETGDVALAQVSVEDRFVLEAARKGNTFLFLDTDLLSNVAYNRHYFGSCSPAIEQLARDRLANHYLLLDVDVPWIPDGVRDGGDSRTEMHQLFVNTLNEFDAPFTSIGGDWQYRRNAVFSAVDRLLREHGIR